MEHKPTNLLQNFDFFFQLRNVFSLLKLDTAEF